MMRVFPGAALCALVGGSAWGLDELQRATTGRAWLEAVVLAIVLGTALRAIWTPDPRWEPGIDFCAKPLLECAVVLLGASVDVPLLVRAGAPLALGIVLVVAIAVGASYVISRTLGLNRRLSLLVASGNSICGNSAIAAVAPAIDANADDVASAIAFTAALGVGVVLVLPPLGHAVGYSPFQFGVLAGLSVYAVPQVLAVTLAYNPVSAQVGTLVKLVRVLMLGPLVAALAYLNGRAKHRDVVAAAPHLTHATMPPLRQLIPWFIVGFVLLAVVRSLGGIDAEQVQLLRDVARWMTILAMAALGLGVDARALGRGGLSVVAAVTLSLVVLLGVSAALIAVLRIA